MVHIFKLEDDYVVVDAGSGSLHITDKLSADVIGKAADGETDSEITEHFKTLGEPEEDVSGILEEIAALRKEGKLFAPDAAELVAPEQTEGGGIIKALCLHMAHSCNLGCKYCFAGQGKYHSDVTGEKALMSLDTAKRAIDFLVGHSGNRNNLEVDFFGGEPLLNFGVVKETVRYARGLERNHKKIFRFTLTTNGLLLSDEITRFCNEEISNVVLSLDGRREIHDAMRVFPNGDGSYGAVVPKIKRFTELRAQNRIGSKSYYIRGTYTNANTDFFNDIAHLYEQGFTELALEPAVLPAGDPLALSESHFETLSEQYEKLAKFMSKNDSLSFYHYMLDLENGPCVIKRVKGCGSGSEYFAVTPEGTLYPCHQLVGETEFIAGDIRSGINPGYKFKRKSINERQECRDCWAKLWCSGGCAANAYHSTGTTEGTDEFSCKLFKRRLECALWLAAVREIAE